MISILKSLQSKIGKFSVIGGCAYILQTGINKKPKDIDLLVSKEFTSEDFEKIGLTNYSLYQNSQDSEGIVSDFEFKGYNVQLVYEKYNEWDFNFEFKFETISGLRVATLESILDNTLNKKIKKYSDLPILLNWSPLQFSTFLNKMRNEENRKTLLQNFFIINLSDDDFDNNLESLQGLKVSELSRNKDFIRLFRLII